jgi:hypothetical protein
MQGHMIVCKQRHRQGLGACACEKGTHAGGLPNQPRNVTHSSHAAAMTAVRPPGVEVWAHTTFCAHGNATCSAATVRA